LLGPGWSRDCRQINSSRRSTTIASHIASKFWSF
jgi:hypothetical protein